MTELDNAFHNIISDIWSDMANINRGMEKEYKRLQAERDEWKADAERLAKSFVIEVYPHEWVCRSGCHHMGKTPDTIDHSPNCPITLHRQLVEKYKKEVME